VLSTPTGVSDRRPAVVDALSKLGVADVTATGERV